MQAVEDMVDKHQQELAEKAWLTHPSCRGDHLSVARHVRSNRTLGCGWHR